MKQKYMKKTTKNKKKPIKTEKMDFFLFGLVIVMVLAGTIMLISSSVAYSYHEFDGDSYLFVKKQVLFLIIGSIAMAIMFFLRIDYIKKLSPLIYIAAVLLLGSVYIDGIGRVFNDARRWILIGPINLQPSETYKFAIILFLANRLSWDKHQVDKFWKFIVYLLFIGLPLILVYFQPHISAMVIIMAIGVGMLFISGMKKRYLIPALGLAASVVAYMIKTKPYALARFMTFLDLEKDPTGDSMQILQSLYAITSGGTLGKGLGKSLRKYLYIPEPYNDFIFSVYVEEFGFVGALLLLIAFALLIYKGFKIATEVKDKFMSLTAAGITLMIALQVVINIAVVTASMPVTGMPLPFFSYGGTAFIILMAQMGLLLNISQYRKTKGLFR